MNTTVAGASCFGLHLQVLLIGPFSRTPLHNGKIIIRFRRLLILDAPIPELKYHINTHRYQISRDAQCFAYGSLQHW